MVYFARLLQALSFHLYELMTYVHEASLKVSAKPKEVDAVIKMMKDLDTYNDVLKEKITLIKQAKKALMYKIIR